MRGFSAPAHPKHQRNSFIYRVSPADKRSGIVCAAGRRSQDRRPYGFPVAAGLPRHLPGGTGPPPSMKMREAPWTAVARRRLCLPPYINARRRRAIALMFVLGVIPRRRRAAAVQGTFGTSIFMRAGARSATAKNLRSLTGSGTKHPETPGTRGWRIHCFGCMRRGSRQLTDCGRETGKIWGRCPRVADIKSHVGATPRSA